MTYIYCVEWDVKLYCTIPYLPKKFKMNYAKIEFLSISGAIFSPASGASHPDPNRVSALVPICLYCLNCMTFG